MSIQSTSKPRRRHFVRWIILGLFLAAIVWTFASHNPFAQGVQGLLGRPHDETIIDRSFVVPARARTGRDAVAFIPKNRNPEFRKIGIRKCILPFLSVDWYKMPFWPIIAE